MLIPLAGQATRHSTGRVTQRRRWGCLTFKIFGGTFLKAFREDTNISDICVYCILLYIYVYVLTQIIIYMHINRNYIIYTGIQYATYIYIYVYNCLCQRDLKPQKSRLFFLDLGHFGSNGKCFFCLHWKRRL